MRRGPGIVAAWAVACGAVLPLPALAQEGASVDGGAESIVEERKRAEEDLGIIDVKRGGARLRWVWPEFDTEHTIVTSVAGAVVIGTAIAPTVGLWDERIGIDESVRDAIRLDSSQHRLWARDASDVLLSLMTSWPLIVDSVIVSAYYRSSPEVAIQLALVSTETMVVNAAITGTIKMLTGRERPYGRDCGGEIDLRTDDCQRRDRERSFFSGHASQTFASAALTCMNHLNLPLYGGGTADTLVCPVAFALAGTTATLRVAADRHYFVDVTAGALMGTTVGLLVPWLFYYRHEPVAESAPADEPSASVRLVPTGNGAAVVGVF